MNGPICVVYRWSINAFVAILAATLVPEKLTRGVPLPMRPRFAGVLLPGTQVGTGRRGHCGSIFQCGSISFQQLFSLSLITRHCGILFV